MSEVRVELLKLKARAEARARTPRPGVLAAWRDYADELGELLKRIDAPEPPRCKSLDLSGGRCVAGPHHVGSCKPGRVA